MTRRLAALLLALAVWPALLVAGAGSSRASPAGPAGNGAASSGPGESIGIKLLQAPASEQNDPRAYTYIIDHLNPRTIISRPIQVSDAGDTPVQVSVYAAAASISGGSFRFAPANTQNEMTTWVHTSHPLLNLQPGQRATDTVTIDVPGDATRGEHYGVIWAQLGGPAGQGNIKLISRVGIRIYLSVGPGGAPPSSFTAGTPTATGVGGRPVLQVPVQNTGGRAVDIAGLLSLSSGPDALRAGPFRAQAVVTLAPGQSGTVSYVLAAALPNGPWQALTTLQSGMIVETQHFSADFSAPVRAAAIFPVVLTAGLAAMAVLLALGARLIVRHRRRRGRPGPGSHESGTPALTGA